MQNIFTALGFWLIEIRITFCKRAKELAPLSSEMQTKSCVERVTCFVAQNAHAFSVSPTFHFQHLLSLELHQAWVGQVKGDGNSRDTVRRETFVRKPHVRLKSNAPFIQFAIETLDMRFEKRSLNLERQIANPHVQQMFVR